MSNKNWEYNDKNAPYIGILFREAKKIIYNVKLYCIYKITLVSQYKPSVICSDKMAVYYNQVHLYHNQISIYHGH